MAQPDFSRTVVTADNHEEVEAQVRDAFTYHPWDEAKIRKGAIIKTNLEVAVLNILSHVKPSATRTRAINALTDCRMLVNQSLTFED